MILNFLILRFQPGLKVVITYKLFLFSIIGNHIQVKDVKDDAYILYKFEIKLSEDMILNFLPQ